MNASVRPGAAGSARTPDRAGAARESGPRRLPVIGRGADAVEPRVVGEAAWRGLYGWVERLDALIERHIPSRWNPFAQTGAIANACLMVAVVSGVLLLFWWKASVHQAYDSVVGMSAHPYTAGLLRSLHRYSSDAALCFVLVHMLRLLLQRRATGTRWLAWVTGVILLGGLWFVGWLGYWLVWDQRGQLVALATAHMLDGLPVFTDSLSRSFLVDAKINSLLFFVVFFVHMLLPLAMGIALWLHIKRLSRSRFITGAAVSWWVCGALLVLSLVAPADSAPAARMAVVPQHVTADYWYLAPIAFTQRFSAGVLWSVVLLGGALLFSLPWSLTRRRARPARVVPERCNACEKCYADCPYDAIQMVPRSGGKPHPTVASVVPDKCVGCGICAGSCDSAGVGLAWFDAVDQRRRIDALLAADTSGVTVVFICDSAPDLQINPADGRCHELPGCVVLRIPCAGWLHPLSVERVLRHGAGGAIVVTCAGSSCRYREGAEWTRQRMAGQREPALRVERVDRTGFLVVALYAHQRRELIAQVADFREGNRVTAAAPRTSALGLGAYLAAVVLAALVSGGLWFGSQVAHADPRSSEPRLVISFKHSGDIAEACRPPTAEELSRLPAHMRPKEICERRRNAVRLRVTIDGRTALSKSYEPRGVWHDGTSVAVEELLVSPGKHSIRVEIGDKARPDQFNWSDERSMDFASGRRAAVLFDRLSGFQWHE